MLKIKLLMIMLLGCFIAYNVIPSKPEVILEHYMYHTGAEIAALIEMSPNHMQIKYLVGDRGSPGAWEERYMGEGNSILKTLIREETCQVASTSRVQDESYKKLLNKDRIEYIILCPTSDKKYATVLGYTAVPELLAIRQQERMTREIEERWK